MLYQSRGTYLSEAPTSPDVLPRILVIDDDPDVRGWLRDSLASFGFAVIEAKNGKDATSLLKRETFDLCITDLAMPEQEGIETIQILRRDYPALKIIADLRRIRP